MNSEHKSGVIYICLAYRDHGPLKSHVSFIRRYQMEFTAACLYCSKVNLLSKYVAAYGTLLKLRTMIIKFNCRRIKMCIMSFCLYVNKVLDVSGVVLFKKITVLSLRSTSAIPK